jgi:hypothetical protein
MKTLLFGAFAVFLVACAENTSSKQQINDETDLKAKQEQIEKDQVLAQNKRRDSINVLLNGISVQFFEHSGGVYDMDGWCIDGGRITRLKNFDNANTYTCSKGAYIQKVVISGNCKNINLKFFNAKDEIVKDLNDFTLEDEVEFETEIIHNPGSGSCEEKKGPNHAAWFRDVTKMTLSYNDSVFYSASWQSSPQRSKQ